MEIDIWSDEFGVIWELVELSYGEGSEFLIRERNTLDALDGDSREGLAILARFQARKRPKPFCTTKGSSLGPVQFEGAGSRSERRYHFKEIANDAVRGDLENRCFGIFVDGHNIFTRTHAREMLNGAADAASDVERWADHFSRLAHLHAVR